MMVLRHDFGMVLMLVETGRKGGSAEDYQVSGSRRS